MTHDYVQGRKQRPSLAGCGLARVYSACRIRRCFSAERQKPHAKQWANLQAQITQPLMHADMVPTLLAAAGVAYDDSRPLATDLLDRRLPLRQRTIQRALGAVIDWETLVHDAQ